MTGGVSHIDSFDPKPRLFAGASKTVRVDNFQGKPGDFTMYLKAPQFAFRPGGSCGTEVSDLFPHVRSVRRRPLRDPLDVVGPHQPLRGDARHAHRVVHLRPAEPRRVGQLRPGDREPRLPLVRGGRAPCAVRRHADLGLRLPARLPPGDAHRARPVADRQRRPARRLRRAPAARAGGDRRGRPPAPRRPTRRRRARGPHPLVRDRLRHAARGARAVRPLGRDRRDTRPLRPGARPDRRVRLAVPGRPPPGRARRPVRRADRLGLVEQLGRPRQHDGARPPGPERRPRHRRADRGPQESRAARRHAGGLDHRVRPDPVQRGPRCRRPRAPSPVLLVVAGRRRRQGRDRSTAPPTSYGIAVARGPRPRPRLPRHDPAPAGPRPHPAHLPPRRPRLPAHGRLGERGRGRSSPDRPTHPESRCRTGSEGLGGGGPGEAPGASPSDFRPRASRERS